jgi:large subunit ribosomal protein L44e
MVVIPKKAKKFCPHCGKMSECKVSLAKSGGNRGALTKGQRRHERRSGVQGYGGSPKQKAAHKAKTSKRTNIRYKCATCSKQWGTQKNFRAKKLTQK